MSNKPLDSKRPESELKNNLKSIRTRLGLSQSELAAAAGITRQTIGGIEASHYAPSAAVALRLARALGCRVEELFWLENEPSVTIRANLASHDENTPIITDERVLVGRVGQRFVAHPLSGDSAFRSEMIPADGLASPLKGGELEVQLLDSLESLERSVLIAGCSPELSLWTASAKRWHPGLRANWIHANSTKALEYLARGEVHIAGLHLCDPQTGEENVPFVRPLAKANDPIVLLNFGIWEEGLLLPNGNPHQIGELADLTNPKVKFINREPGAGSRLLFDTLLAEANIPAQKISGYEQTATSHRAVASAITEGTANAGMGTAAIAGLYNLDFLPLRKVRFDFAVYESVLAEEAVAQMFETLTHKSVRLQLQKLGGYDTSKTGEVVARVGI